MNPLHLTAGGWRLAGRLGAAVLLPVLLFFLCASDGPLPSDESLRHVVRAPGSTLLPPGLAADGEELYQAHCATCHGGGGSGIPGVFPPLKGSRWVTGEAGRLVRVLLQGMRGEVEVRGQTYSGPMPPWEAALSNQEIAQVATYVRAAWGNEAGAVSTETVARVREATRGRDEPWTVAALKAATERDGPEADNAGERTAQAQDAAASQTPEAASVAEEPEPAAAVSEADYYRIVTLPIPEGLVLEVGGLAIMPGGQLAVATRRGDVWLVENPSMRGGSRPHFTRFAQGLHEPLGLAYHQGALYTAQRNGLTRLADTDGDGRADVYETIYTWPISGNYHEYAFGPEIGPEGNFIVSLNVGWIGRGASLVPWRGWIVKITPGGEMIPLAAGMRSPAGLGFNAEGDLFYAENQGDWIGSGRITHIEKGDFGGHVASLKWTGLPKAPAELRGLSPQDVPDTGKSMHEAKKEIPAIKLPTVWLPHGIMGISTSDILPDTTGGAFGPFEGQLFVGDQGQSKIMRVFLEKVEGVYQGAAFPFREGFSSGIVRLAWGGEGSLYVGMTARGWDAVGERTYGLQRVAWTGKMPFEVETMRATPNGFALTFTKPVDRTAAQNPDRYHIESFTYKYHSTYGSPIIDEQKVPVRAAEVSEDGRRVRLVVEGLRRHYIHELKIEGLRARDGTPLLHDTAYYTLHRLPNGEPQARLD